MPPRAVGSQPPARHCARGMVPVMGWAAGAGGEPTGHRRRQSWAAHVVASLQPALRVWRGRLCAIRLCAELHVLSV